MSASPPDGCSSFPTDSPQLTSIYLNPNSLRVAAARLKRYRPRAHQADMLEDWALSRGAMTRSR
jgi:hypothetical protein